MLRFGRKSLRFKTLVEHVVKRLKVSPEVVESFLWKGEHVVCPFSGQSLLDVKILVVRHKGSKDYAFVRAGHIGQAEKSGWEIVAHDDTNSNLERFYRGLLFGSIWAPGKNSENKLPINGKRGKRRRKKFVATNRRSSRYRAVKRRQHKTIR